MADYAPNFTGRVRYTYVGATGTHTHIVRATTGSTLAGFLNSLAAYETAIRSALSQEAVITARDSAAPGSNLFLPTAWTPVNGTGPNTQYANQQKAYAIAIPGRTLFGNKGRVYLFNVGVFEGSDANWVQNGAELFPQFRAIVTAVNANEQIAGSDGSKLVLRERATIKTNDRYVRILRRT